MLLSVAPLGHPLLYMGKCHEVDMHIPRYAFLAICSDCRLRIYEFLFAKSYKVWFLWGGF